MLCPSAMLYSIVRVATFDTVNHVDVELKPSMEGISILKFLLCSSDHLYPGLRITSLHEILHPMTDVHAAKMQGDHKQVKRPIRETTKWY